MLSCSAIVPNNPYLCTLGAVGPYCDTLSFCLSKGLGAPIGSVLVGSEEVIEKARRHRQMLGGGMRQAGIVAAAGLYAMRNNISRLKSDHARATELAATLSRIPGLTVETPQTNMVFCDVDASVRGKFSGFLKETGVRISGNSKRQRWVTHLGIDDTALASTVKLLAQMQDVCDAS